MLDTWQKERAHRPAFASVVKTLDKLICCPETLKKIASSPAHQVRERGREEGISGLQPLGQHQNSLCRGG